MHSLLRVLFIVCVIGSYESARILAVYPVPSISHQVVFRPLMQELARRGHEVVVITTDPAFPKGQAPQNLTEIDVHDISYKIWNDFLAAGKGQTHISDKQIKVFSDVLLEVLKAQVQSEDVQKLITNKDKSFDLIFVEACVRPALSFASLYGRELPIIEFSSFGGLCGTFDETGAPTNYLVYSRPSRQKVYNLTIWEKISVVYNEYKIDKACIKNEDLENKAVKKLFGLNTPDLKELKKNVQLTFLNVNPIWDFNRPVPPHIIYLGGIHQKPHRELPMDIKTYLDSSKNGVIYMSFGTNARPSLLPTEILRIFTNVFSQLPYDILWKWDEDELPNRSKNIRISKWLPQSDLLKHPNVKVFITQGGLQSTDEALTAGVPLVVIPFLGDQWFNAEHYVKLRIGIRLDLETISETKLKTAIETIIEDKTYRENIVNLNKLMRDQPQSPLERAVWWTEYVLRHGGATHLRAAGAHMHWTEYYALDIILIILSISFALFLGIVLAIRYLVHKLKNRTLIFRKKKIK